MKPIINKPPSAIRQPVVGAVKTQRRFVFSFRFYKQQKFFGLGGLDSSWFAGLFDKLTEISDMSYEHLMQNFKAKNAWRLHEVNFAAKNCPVARKELSWIHKDYLNNLEEYPFFQFQITKSHGRVIGFWDETGVFNIVFLDPLHNMQPSDYSDYKVRDTVLAASHFSAAISIIETSIANCQGECGCRQIYPKLQDILAGGTHNPALLVSVSAGVFERANRCVQDGLARVMEDIIEEGLKCLEY